MSEAATPLIAEAEAAGGGNDSCLWWKKILNWEEAKHQILFSLPMILTNVAYYCIPLISVMFAGHLGEAELAASNLANSWATVTGLSFMVSRYSSVTPNFYLQIYFLNLTYTSMASFIFQFPFVRINVWKSFTLKIYFPNS